MLWIDSALSLLTGHGQPTQVAAPRHRGRLFERQDCAPLTARAIDGQDSSTEVFPSRAGAAPLASISRGTNPSHAQSVYTKRTLDGEKRETHICPIGRVL